MIVLHGNDSSLSPCNGLVQIDMKDGSFDCSNVQPMNQGSQLPHTPTKMVSSGLTSVLEMRDAKQTFHFSCDCFEMKRKIVWLNRGIL